MALMYSGDSTAYGGAVDGSGSGDGDGDGSGSGSGSGDGDGSGYGDGYGSGSGYGSGYGSGDGDGYGSGYGSGDGDGDGSGLNTKQYLVAYLEHVGGDAAKVAIANGAVLAVWRSKKDGRPANGGSDEPAYPGKVNTEKGPLSLCGIGTLHATLTPDRWRGERFWCVAMYPPFEEQNDKLGSLKREIICEIPELYKQHT